GALRFVSQVSVPKDLVAVMSAVRDGQEVDPQDNNRIIYRFRQPVAMPSYLIAIVVGALESREIGPRSRVWSEKEFVDKAAFEFSEVSHDKHNHHHTGLTVTSPSLTLNQSVNWRSYGDIEVCYSIKTSWCST
ncbi:leukotriene A-4 hydrolase-like, partial [Plectropomus leopardus]|uniref:leukotriene A-4 hydrolase-like n=1 Tax=Plectropomus leopardus TaxID=160734 RepID=UPI001C4C193B